MSDASAGATARPFQIALPLFQGQLDELVRMAVDRKLSTEAIEVAQVTAQFAGYLGTRDAIDLEETGEFLAAATRLLLLKSSRVLAQPVSLDEERAPQLQQDVWIERPILESLSERLARAEGRESLAPPTTPYHLDRRLEPHSAGSLRRVWNDLQNRRGRDAAPVTVPAFVRLETAVSTLIRRLKASVRVPFKEIVAGATRNDVVIHFLAVLELVRRRQMSVSQSGPFAEMTLDYVEQPTDAASRAG